jgi:ParB/RepB/Spo0J family partition protein
MAVNFNTENKRTSEYRFYPEDISIKPDLNGRHEKPEIEWLIADILTKGQHTPVAIRSDGGTAVLVAGFSRWRAISEINKRKLAPVKMQIRCTYIQCSTDAEAFLHNISENRFRNPTTPLDDAHNIKRLLNVYAMTDDQVAWIYFPTAKTESELKAARKFVKDRIALISLSPEAADAVRSGRVKENAATAISKLSQDQQREVLKKPGTIERKDVSAPKAPKAPKPTPRDPELMRRISAVLEDVIGVLLAEDREDEEYIEVDRVLLLNLHTYVEEISAK